LTWYIPYGRMQSQIFVFGEIMSATIILREKDFKIKHGMTIRNALQKLNIQSESVLPTRNGELVTDDETIHDGDVIKLVMVISGG